MEGMHNIGPAAPTPREKKMYAKEYKHGAELFQRALDSTTKSDNPYQKQKFQEVMDQAMMVLNQAAGGLKRSDLIEQNKQIAKDYAAFKAHPNGQMASRLNHDLDRAKKSIS